MFCKNKSVILNKYLQITIKLRQRSVYINEKKYEVPVMEIIEFDSEDIITTSGVTIDPNPDVPNGDVDFGDWR